MMNVQLNVWAALGICTCSALFQGCSQQNQSAAEQQQNFICNALIEGFLKAQNLTQYELRLIQPVSAGALNEKIYVYGASQGSRQNLGGQPSKLRFACQQISARQIQIKLHDPKQPAQQMDILLSIELPQPLKLQRAAAFNAYSAPILHR